VSTSVSRAHIFVRGRVQGVNFRARTRQQARAAGVAGWVRNLDDGRVEAVFEGDREAVELLVRWCHSGPSLARVEYVEVAWEPPTGNHGSFEVRW
jgi:acylphosphatase